MTDFVFPPPAQPSVAVSGSRSRFPVHRIYCVGLNYADHIKETGADPKAPPVFFMKPADAVMGDGEGITYPSATKKFHYEAELVVALGSGGSDIDPKDTLAHVFGYAVGNDLTRRDLQRAAKDRGQPWDIAKGFDHSAPIGAIRPANAGHIARGRIWLKLNGELRQDSDVGQLVMDVPHTIAALSRLYRLQAGDLIFTGTPSGVGPLKVGDRIECGIEGLDVLHSHIVAAS
jgi:fumarylpyruvate hydrolase